jgi:hypothetical protein
MLLTATQQIFIKTAIPKLKQSALVTFKLKKVKVKLSCYMPNRHRGEAEIQLYRYLTQVLEWGGWSVPCPDCFNPRKETQYPLYRRLGGLQGQSGWVQKICPHQGSNPRPPSP